MKPEKNDNYIQIPVTFDSSSKPGGLTNDKFILAILVMGVWLALSIFIMFSEWTLFQKIGFDLISFIISLSFSRYIILRERYFMKRRNELQEKDYKITYSNFWNIYEVTNSYPYICRYANGLKAIFVMFEKDVIVGRDLDNDYYHYEAIAEAYLQMSKRGIDCMHIDYMDTVGKDDRINVLFDMASKSENPILGDVLTRIFDNVEGIMQSSYASYDVYCFYYAGKDELFMDELDVVINAFLEGNYLRYTVLDKEAIGELVKSVFNIEKFSVNYASEKLFSDIGSTSYLKPIWVERAGERKILNKTREELEEERKTREAEKDLRRSRTKPSSRGGRMVRKLKDEEEIDLFGDSSNDNQDYENGYDNQGYLQDYENQENTSGYYNEEYIEENNNQGYTEGYDSQDYVEDYNNQYVENNQEEIVKKQSIHNDLPTRKRNVEVSDEEDGDDEIELF